jgi:hypothetical protein
MKPLELTKSRALSRERFNIQRKGTDLLIPALAVPSEDNKSTVLKSMSKNRGGTSNPYSEFTSAYGRRKPPQKVQLDRIMRVCET